MGYETTNRPANCYGKQGRVKTGGERMSKTTSEPHVLIKLTTLHASSDLKKPSLVVFAEYVDGIYTGRYWQATITGKRLFELLKPFLKEKRDF